MTGLVPELLIFDYNENCWYSRVNPITFNPLTPKIDQHVPSLQNIHTLSRKQVMRILKVVR